MHIKDTGELHSTGQVVSKQFRDSSSILAEKY